MKTISIGLIKLIKSFTSHHSSFCLSLWTLEHAHGELFMVKKVLLAVDSRKLSIGVAVTEAQNVECEDRKLNFESKKLSF